MFYQNSPLTYYKGHTMSVTSLAVDESNVLTGSLDNKAILFDKLGRITKTLYGHNKPITAVALSK